MVWTPRRSTPGNVRSQAEMTVEYLNEISDEILNNNLNVTQIEALLMNLSKMEKHAIVKRIDEQFGKLVDPTHLSHSEFASLIASLVILPEGKEVVNWSYFYSTVILALLSISWLVDSVYYDMRIDAVLRLAEDVYHESFEIINSEESLRPRIRYCDTDFLPVEEHVIDLDLSEDISCDKPCPYKSICYRGQIFNNSWLSEPPTPEFVQLIETTLAARQSWTLCKNRESKNFDQYFTLKAKASMLKACLLFPESLAAQNIYCTITDINEKDIRDLFLLIAGKKTIDGLEESKLARIFMYNESLQRYMQVWSTTQNRRMQSIKCTFELYFKRFLKY